MGQRPRELEEIESRQRKAAARFVYGLFIALLVVIVALIGIGLYGYANTIGGGGHP